jgi:hypothetical protein
VFAAIINRAALTSSMDTDHRTSSPPHDPARWRPLCPPSARAWTALRPLVPELPLEGFRGGSASRGSCTRVGESKLPTHQLFPAIRNFSLNPHPRRLASPTSVPAVERCRTARKPPVRNWHDHRDNELRPRRE